MSRTFSTPRVEGAAARQAHADIPDGTYEREIGREGFSGPAAHMYHRNPPTAWTGIDGPIRPRALSPAAVAVAGASPWEARDLLGNAHAKIRYWRAAGAMDHLARNGDGDDLLFVHRGQGELFCDYGHLSFGEGDYLLIPRGTMWRVEIDGTADMLMIEATGGCFRQPERGLLGRHALFDPGVLDAPALDDAFRAQRPDGEWEVRVKRRGQIGRIAYPFNPLDAVGWKGDLHPVRLNLRDIRPVMSARLHLPPSVRATFVCERFVVCSIVPRPVETDPGAVKLPFFHSNDDVDEVIFYHRGAFYSRGAAVGEGMLTFHPSGFTHGPHPDVLPYMLQHPAKSFENYSVMIDTFDPLDLAPQPDGGEVSGYAESWRRSIERAPDARRPARSDAE